MKPESEQVQLIAECLRNQDPREGRTLRPAEFGGPWRSIAFQLASGLAPAAVVEHMEPTLLSQVGAVDPEREPPPPLRTITARDLLATTWAEPRWAVPGLLPIGLTLLAGKPKVGKSWLALQIAQAVATGGRVFDRDVDTGPVLYLALEDGPRRLQERMRRQRWPADRGGDAEFMNLSAFLEQIGDLARGGARLADQMSARCYRLVVVDTVARGIRGDPNAADVAIAALSPLQAVAVDMEACVLAIDHHHKNGMGDPVADVLGSTEKAGTADALWGLYVESGKRGARLHVIGRDLDEQELALHFDEETLCWQCDGDAGAAKQTEAREVVIGALETLGSATLTQICQETGADKGNTYKLLQNMVRDGQLARALVDGQSRYSV